MARQLRIQYPDAFYHVTSRGNEQKEIFRGKEDYELFLEQLSESLAVHNVSLLGYVHDKSFPSVTDNTGWEPGKLYASFQYWVYRCF